MPLFKRRINLHRNLVLEILAKTLMILWAYWLRLLYISIKYILKYFRLEFIIFLILRRLKMSNWNIRVGWLWPPSLFSGTGRPWQDQSAYITTSLATALPEVTCEHFSSFKIINCRHSVCRAPPSHLPWLHHPRISPRHPDPPYPGTFLPFPFPHQTPPGRSVWSPYDLLNFHQISRRPD